MKKILTAFAAILTLTLFLAAAGMADGSKDDTQASSPELTLRPEDRPRIILYCLLKEKADSETVSVCCIDREGTIWTAEDVSSGEDILQMLMERRDMKSGSLLHSLGGGKDATAERFRELAVMADVVKEA